MSPQPPANEPKKFLKASPLPSNPALTRKITPTRAGTVFDLLSVRGKIPSTGKRGRVLDSNGVYRMLRLAGRAAAPDDADALLVWFDADGDGAVSREDFISASTLLMEQAPNDVALSIIASEMDPSRSGVVTANQVASVVKSHAYPSTTALDDSASSGIFPSSPSSSSPSSPTISDRGWWSSIGTVSTSGRFPGFSELMDGLSTELAQQEWEAAFGSSDKTPETPTTAQLPAVAFEGLVGRIARRGGSKAEATASGLFNSSSHHAGRSFTFGDYLAARSAILGTGCAGKRPRDPSAGVQGLAQLTASRTSTPPSIGFGMELIIAGFAGLVGASAVYPLDLAKTRLQASRGGPNAYHGMVDVLRRTAALEGIGGLYRGLPAQWVGIMPEKAIKLSVNAALRTAFSSDNNPDHVGIFGAIAAGGLAGATQVAVTCPYELVKLRRQLGGAGPGAKSAPAIVKELGIKGLYKGVTATLARDVGFSVVYFPLYGIFKEKMRNSYTGDVSFMGMFTASTIAGVAAAAASTPADVVKTRMQAESPAGTPGPGGSALQTTRDILQKEGPMALTKGMTPRVVLIAPLFGIAMAVFEVMTAWWAPEAALLRTSSGVDASILGEAAADAAVARGRVWRLMGLHEHRNVANEDHEE